MYIYIPHFFCDGLMLMVRYTSTVTPCVSMVDAKSSIFVRYLAVVFYIHKPQLSHLKICLFLGPFRIS